MSWDVGPNGQGEARGGDFSVVETTVSNPTADPFYRPPCSHAHPLVWILDDVAKCRESDVRALWLRESSFGSPRCLNSPPLERQLHSDKVTRLSHMCITHTHNSYMHTHMPTHFLFMHDSSPREGTQPR
jgi:hypothetical protein